MADDVTDIRDASLEALLRASIEVEKRRKAEREAKEHAQGILDGVRE